MKIVGGLGMDTTLESVGGEGSWGELTGVPVVVEHGTVTVYVLVMVPVVK